MRHLRAWILRALGAFTGSRRDRDLSDELASHVQLHVDDNLRAGMAPDEARRQAMLKLGGVEATKERYRDRRGLPWLDSLAQDVRHGVRFLRRSPGFTAVAILSLALGIGATTAVFSVLDSVLLRPLPYPQAGKLVELRQAAPGAPGLADLSDGLMLSPSMYFTYADANHAFQSIGVWTTGTASVTGLAEPEQVRTGLVSGGVLEALGVPPAAGRWLSPADQIPASSAPTASSFSGPSTAAMLSYGYWQRRFGGARTVVGRRLIVDGRPREIVGVMPRGFRLVDADFDLLLPLAFARDRLILAGFGYHGLARLKAGTTIAEADADMARMVPIWMHSWSNGPGTNPLFYETWRITPALRPLRDEVIGNVSRMLWVVMGAVGLLLLIACTNVATLLLVRFESRRHELAIRSALGAGRGRIVRGLLVQSLLLGCAGGALGVALAWAGLRTLVAAGPTNLPRLSEIGLNLPAVAVAVVLSLVSSALFGLIPALEYTGRRNPFVLRSAERSTTSSRGSLRSRHSLVIVQVATAAVLLVSAGLMIRTFQALRAVQPGFTDAAHVQTLRITIPSLMVDDPRQVTRMQNAILDALRAIPGVEAAGFGSAVPMEEAGRDWDEVQVEHQPATGGPAPLRLYENVSPGFLQAMGTRIVAGRDLTWTEVYDLRPVVLVSENLAREIWGTPSAAVGKRLREFTSTPWYEVIGVVEDVRQNGVQDAAPATVYWPSMMNGLRGPHTFGAVRAVTFALRSPRANTESFLREIRQAVWSVNASLPLAAVQTMGAIEERSLQQTSFTLVMLAIAGVMALLLGVIGIYGVVSYAVSRRTREIGIRLALGARRTQVLKATLGSGLSLVLIGLAVGVAGAFAVTRVLSSLLYGVHPTDPLTFAAVCLLLVAVALAACFIPARRAANVDPNVALRCD